jgi:hypothetical protein
MQRLLVVDGNFFALLDVAQRKEQYVPIQSFHVSIWPARVIDVMSSVTAAAAVQAPAAVNVTDAQLGPARATLRFEIRDSFAGVFGDLASALKTKRREASFAVDGRFAN